MNHHRSLCGFDFQPGNRALLFNLTTRKLKFKWRGTYLVVDKFHEINAIPRIYMLNLCKLKRCYRETLSTNVEWANKRLMRVDSRGRLNRNEVLESKGSEDLTYQGVITYKRHSSNPISQWMFRVISKSIKSIRYLCLNL